MRAPLIIAAVLAVSLAACTPEPLEFPDWTISVPEGTRIIEYAAVPMEERTERIELVEDLVIGERDNDPNYIFYNPAAVAVDSDRQIFVLDAGNHRVQVFDWEGRYLRTLGTEGHGPGELAGPTGIAVAGDHLIIGDIEHQRYSVWALGGSLIGDHQVSVTSAPYEFVGLGDGTVIGTTTLYDEPTTDDDFRLRHQIGIFTQEGLEVVGIQEFPGFSYPLIRRSEPPSDLLLYISIRMPVPEASFGTTPEGDIYASSCAEYQVHAYDRTGKMRWALRTPWERQALADEEIERAMTRVRLQIEDASRSEVDWPELYPALSHVAVDGHGHVYVFLQPGEVDAADFPVDVYSATGERLFSGWTPRMKWQVARGDFVFGLETDEASGEERLVRYRLVEPF